MLNSNPKNTNIPIFFVNGIFSSPIYVRILDKDKYSKLLPRRYKNFIETASSNRSLIWPPGELDLQDISCLFETVVKREKNGEITIKPPDGLKIETDPIQKVSNFQSNGIEKYNIELPIYLHGYKNVFNVPYDWYHYFYNTNEVFTNLKEKIEREVQKTGRKAVLVGYSLGGHFIRYFLNDFSNKKWNLNHIAGIQFGSSVIAGAFPTLIHHITGQFPTNALFKTDFFKHMPSFTAMFPNFHANKKVIKKTVINSKSQIETKFLDASQIFERLKKSKKIDKMTELLYLKGLNFFKEDIVDPGIKSFFIFNSGIPTINKINITVKNSKNSYEIVYGEGDGMMPTNGIKYVINKWSNVSYHDFNTNDKKFGHLSMIKQPEYSKLTREFIDSL